VGRPLHQHRHSKRSGVDFHPSHAGLFLNNDAVAFKPIGQLAVVSRVGQNSGVQDDFD
jgi:hypothetical protein